ncbi:Uncharacterised protein [Mycobacterium tuberculosis]|nr:Uncharacterised protein [Mycobacterium tuberculosis]
MNLVRLHHKVLAQHRNRNRGPHRVEVVERSLKTPLLSHHADDPGTAILVGLGQLCRVGDGRQCACRRTSALDLSDDADAGLA